MSVNMSYTASSVNPHGQSSERVQNASTNGEHDGDHKRWLSAFEVPVGTLPPAATARDH